MSAGYGKNVNKSEEKSWKYLKNLKEQLRQDNLRLSTREKKLFEGEL